MKKILILLATLLPVALFFSCGKEEMPLEETTGISFRFTVADPGQGTRAVKKGWEVGDILYLWFSPITQPEPDLSLTYDGTDWKSGALRKGCQLADEGTFHVVYGGRNDISTYGAAFSRSGQAVYQYTSESVSSDGKPSGQVYWSDLQACSQNIPYKVVDDLLTASISDWQFLSDFQITLTNVPRGEYALLCETGKGSLAVPTGFQLAGGTGGSVCLIGQDTGYYASAKASGGEAVFYFVRLNDSEITEDINLTLIPKRGGVYSLSNAVQYSPGTKKLDKVGNVQAVTLPFTKFIRTPDVVDLGLSVKWSSFNLGATAPGEYGYHYAFGEKEVKDEYVWETYLLCYAYNRLIKYCPVDKENYWGGSGSPDGKTVLDLKDDVANVKLGGKWRMPTHEEWVELRNKCTWTWTTQDGLNGYKVSRNGNSIFLPAAGYSTMTVTSGEGKYGYYWSSSIYEEAPYLSWFLYFGPEQLEIQYDPGYRCSGFAVRPVLGK